MTAAGAPLPVAHAESAAHVQTLVIDARESGTGLRIVGGGTWLDAGRPDHATCALSTRALTDVIEYVPGDLVITVGAGVTLASLEAVTAAHGQWLALDPFTSTPGLTHATIGATIATASHGPLASGYGRVRDLVLGVTFVTGTGQIARAGGRVVKNVAGFDLVRLMTGAWGSLGIITEVSLRLHARPVVDETIAVAIDLPERKRERHLALAALVTQLNSAPLLATTTSLAALVLLPSNTRERISPRQALPSAGMLLLARAVGNRGRVDAIHRVLAQLGDSIVVDRAVWDAVRTCEHGNTTLRVSDAPMRTADTMQRVDEWHDECGATDVCTLVDPLRGVVRFSGELPPSSSLVPWMLPARAIAERLSAREWPLQSPRRDDHISRELRARFDPAQILNPGLFDGDGPASPAGVRA